jgi:hypothetical protein
MSYYIPLGESINKQSEVVPPRSNFERQPPWYGRIKHAVQSTPSMFQASKVVGCDFKTFRKWAKIYDLWFPNQAGKGISKKRNRTTDLCPICNK